MNSSSMQSPTPLKGSQNYIWSTSDLLGQGATGNVYRARHKKTGELYAVKWFNEQSHMRPNQVQMREFEVLKKLKHGNIVNLLAIEEETQSQQKVLVMELCTEGSLYNILDDTENACGLPEQEFFSVLRDVSAGMKHLRDQGIVHRDIKPGNIMKYVGEDGRSTYKLIDFGAARELSDEEQFVSLYGTEEYLHPDLYERAVLRRPVGKQFGVSVDLWSLGVTLYHVACGQLPFRPFGGRRNRETMYKITTEKESGVVSGVQHSQNGEIIWSRELPPECTLSQGARNLVVPLLAGLLECEPSKIWTFDAFFQQTNDILRKIYLHVFHLGTARNLRIYIDPEEKFSKFQELIAEQVNVPASKQFLLYENIPLSEFVDPYEEVRNYPDTSSNVPFFLFDVDIATVNQLGQPSIPEIPRMQLNVELDEDVTTTKSCGASICHIQRKLSETLLKQELYYKAAKMFIVVLMRQLLQMQAFVTQFDGHLQEIGKRVKEFSTSHKLNMQVVELLQKHVDTPATLELEWEELGLLSNHHTAKFNEVCKQASGIKDNIQHYCDQVISRKELNSHWKMKHGCRPEDRCLDKVDILVKHVKATLVEFRKNRKQRRLSYNEEQIHKFEKSKLMIYMSEAVSLIQSHCYTNLQAVFNTFMGWFIDASKIRKSVIAMEGRMTSLLKEQSTFCEILDQAQQQHAQKFQTLLTRLNNPSTCWVKFPPSQTNGLQEARSTTPATSETQLNALNTQLKSLEGESKSLKDVLQENSNLLEQMECSLTIQPFQLPCGDYLKPK